MKRNSRGFALILVLWFLVLIAAITTYLLANARSEVAVALNVRAAANAEALADAGIAQAVYNHAAPEKTDRWVLDGAAHALALPMGQVSIRVSDEALKINPNTASDVLLSALFEAAGVERGQAKRLGAAIADWVSADEMPRPNGAKQAQYEQAGRSYGPPNAPLENLDELQLVLGMTPQIYAAARPYLTIYTQGGDPDPKNASPVVKRALEIAAMEKESAGGGDADAAETGGDADEGNGDAMPAMPAAPAKTAAADAGMDGGAASANAGNAEAADGAMPEAAMSGPAEILEVEVTARSLDGGTFVRHAVLRVALGNPKGYLVLEWRRGDLAPEDQAPAS